ncbi:MAG: sugar transporter permease [Firmicutes bacterium]|jgi:multiple sugar transport system permease protein|nr:sugar transporter permease [Bacillota bacterium]
MTYSQRRTLGQTATYILLVLGAVLTVFPFLWMIATAFKPSTDIYSLALIPKAPTLANFAKLFDHAPFATWFMNSVVVAGLTTVSVAFFDSLVGYILAKVEFKGRNIIFFAILSSIMIPTEMLIIPWYVGATKVGITDTYLGIMFPGLMTAFGVFLMRQFMEAIPNDLLDAGRIDGLGEFGIWWRVAMPNVRPALAALGILTFLGSWNAFLWPVIAIDSPAMWTLPVGLSYFSYENFNQYELVMAGATMAVIPVLVIFAIFQKQIIKGITLTGIK